MLADVGLQRVGFAVNGVCYGALTFEASRVVLAAALSMKDVGSGSHGDSSPRLMKLDMPGSCGILGLYF